MTFYSDYLIARANLYNPIPTEQTKPAEPTERCTICGDLLIECICDEDDYMSDLYRADATAKDNDHAI